MRRLVACLLIFWGFGTSGVSAQVVINEFSAKSPEWVELYNSTDQEINLTGWFIKDTASHTKELTVSIPALGFVTVDTNWLNDDGDTIFLIDSATSAAVLDTVNYGSAGPILIPPSGKSAGRVPDGSSNWFSDLEISKGAKNPASSPSPTVPPSPTPTHVPTPTKTPAPTHTPSPTKAPTPTNQPQPTTPPATISPKPTAQTAINSTTDTPYSTSKIQDLGSGTPSGAVLSASDSQTPAAVIFPWGAIAMIGLGLSLIGISVFFLFKKPISD